MTRIWFPSEDGNQIRGLPITATEAEAVSGWWGEGQPGNPPSFRTPSTRVAAMASQAPRRSSSSAADKLHSKTSCC